jgi:hypothetical protein
MHGQTLIKNKVCHKGTKGEQKERRTITRKSEKKQDKMLPQAL